MRNWHNNSYKVNRKLYAWNWGGAGGGAAGGWALGSTLGPAGAGAGGLIGAIGGGLFGDSMSKSQSGTEDVLGPIRARLMALADQVPDITAKRATDIKAQGAGYEKTGLKNIAEDLYASRGFGPTSIQGNYNLDFLKNLNDSINSALTQNEYQGLQEQSNILTGAGGMIGTPDQPSMLSSILGQGAGLVGKYLVDKQGTSDFAGMLSKYLNPSSKGPTTSPSGGRAIDISDFLNNLPSSKNYSVSPGWSI